MPSTPRNIRLVEDSEADFAQAVNDAIFDIEREINEVEAQIEPVAPPSAAISNAASDGSTDTAKINAILAMLRARDIISE